jgi:hypothetical protein
MPISIWVIRNERRKWHFFIKKIRFLSSHFPMTVLTLRFYINCRLDLHYHHNCHLFRHSGTRIRIRSWRATRFPFPFNFKSPFEPYKNVRSSKDQNFINSYSSSSSSNFRS